MQVSGFVKVTVTGINGSGAVSAPGLKVGDRLLLNYGPNPSAGFERIVTVDDEIQQNSGFDWTSYTFDLIFIRGI